MNTQTHVLMGAALFGRPATRLAWAGAAGGLIPDLPMYMIVATLRISGYPLDDIFGRLYWSDWWQIANALGHSYLIWGGLFAWSSFMVIRAGRLDSGAIAPLILALSASALLHSMIDMLSHRDDAHMHFWPLSEWRFRSPVSYWDPARYGNWFGQFEAAVGLIAAIALFRRYRSRVLRIALGVAMLLYVAVPAFFILSMSGHEM
jgi:membrane-bound metal-dependent hydrolase YbcI (DUF457 family)